MSIVFSKITIKLTNNKINEKSFVKIYVGLSKNNHGQNMKMSATEQHYYNHW